MLPKEPGADEVKLPNAKGFQVVSESGICYRRAQGKKQVLHINANFPSTF